LIIRAQISFGADSALPRDRFVITPHFRVTDIDPAPGGPDAQALADDLRDGIAGIIAVTPTPSREVIVKLYDAEHVSTPGSPGFPLAEASSALNVYPASGIPRELAVCLSFYNERNLPRRRGRLYIPLALLIGTSVSGSRPSAGTRDAVGLFVPVFTGLGGANVDWGIWSRADRVFRPATHWYVDDEYDVQRRRGLRATTRTVGTTEEAGAVVTP
jgi:hypothetical protein